MKKFVSIDELPRYAPGRNWLSHNLLDGRGVSVRGYDYAASRVSAPGLEEDLVVVYLTGTAEMTRRVGNHTSAARVEPGSVSLLSRNREVAWWDWDKPIRVLHIYLTDAVLRRVHEEMFARPTGGITLRNELNLDDPLMHRIAAEVAEGTYLNGPGAHLFAQALAQQICVHVLRRHIDGAELHVTGSGRLTRAAEKRVTERIEASLDANISLASLAEENGVSEGHFLRQFKATFGVPPHRYVVMRRLEHAKTLLADRDLTIAQIAAGAGFSDQSHFTRLFKRAFQTTPQVWRRERT